MSWLQCLSTHRRSQRHDRTNHSVLPTFLPKLWANLVVRKEFCMRAKFWQTQYFAPMESRRLKASSCKKLGDNNELYCKSVVLLLIEVFESSIDVCPEEYKLDPSHYITAPALSWDAMLKMTEVKLELLMDENMYLYFEEGIWRGTSRIQICKS